MKETKFYKEPAFIFDLIMYIAFNYNKKETLKLLKMCAGSQVILPSGFANQISAEAGDGSPILKESIFPKELLLFFDVQSNKMPFAAQYFIYNLFNLPIENYNLANILKSLDEVDIFRKMIKYYIEEDVIDIDLSPKELYQILGKADISDSIKLYLIYFNNNKKQYVESFKYHLSEKSQQLKRVYADLKVTDEKIEHDLQNEDVFDKISDILDLKVDKGQDLNVSVSQLWENVIWKVKDDFIIVGNNFANKIEEYENEFINLEYTAIGKVFSDKIRMSLLNFLKHEGEMSTTEIANAYEVALPTMFYHLNIMNEAKMLKTRYEGRKVYYSVNPKFFTKFSEKMRDYALLEDEMF